MVFPPVRGPAGRPEISGHLRGYPSRDPIIRGPTMGNISDLGYARRRLLDVQFRPIIKRRGADFPIYIDRGVWRFPAHIT